MTAKPQPKPTLRRGIGPFSRLLDVAEVRDVPLDIAIGAEPAECEAVAAEAGLEGVEGLAARLDVRRGPGGRIDVAGTVEAVVIETCVVSLEPFRQRLDAPVAIAFAPSAVEQVVPVRGRDRRAGTRAEPAPKAMPKTINVAGPEEGEDGPDPIVDGRIDLGAVAVEFMNLARDPYPKKPDVHFTDVVNTDDAEREPTALALALGRLKDRP